MHRVGPKKAFSAIGTVAWGTTLGDLVQGREIHCAMETLEFWKSRGDFEHGG